MANFSLLHQKTFASLLLTHKMLSGKQKLLNFYSVLKSESFTFSPPLSACRSFRSSRAFIIPTFRPSNSVSTESSDLFSVNSFTSIKRNPHLMEVIRRSILIKYCFHRMNLLNMIQKAGGTDNDREHALYYRINGLCGLIEILPWNLKTQDQVKPITLECLTKSSRSSSHQNG
jgi:hypothetical protein